MNIKPMGSLLFASFLLIGGSAYGKQWCCTMDGKVQLLENKKMCVKGKSAPTEKAKAGSKKAKFFAACKDNGGEWTLQEKSHPKKKG